MFSRIVGAAALFAGLNAAPDVEAVTAFSDIAAGLTALYNSDAAWGDYDNDGDLDVLITGATGESIVSKLYRNDGSGVFVDVAAALEAVAFGSGAWGDYD